MTNFEKALQLENEYHKILGDTNAMDLFKFKDKLLDIGYTEQEFELLKLNKQIVELGIEIKEITPDKIFSETKKNIKKKALILVKPIAKCVYNGNVEFNKEYCDNNNIPVYDIGYSGGTIVASSGDLAGILIIDDPRLFEIFQNRIVSWIKENYSNVTTEGNDILVEGYKVFGGATMYNGGRFIFYFQLSFNMDIGLIKSISKKEMIKIPKGLNSFGNKTREDLINDLRLWLQ